MAHIHTSRCCTLAQPSLSPDPAYPQILRAAALIGSGVSQVPSARPAPSPRSPAEGCHGPVCQNLPSVLAFACASGCCCLAQPSSSKLQQEAGEFYIPTWLGLSLLPGLCTNLQVLAVPQKQSHKDPTESSPELVLSWSDGSYSSA